MPINRKPPNPFVVVDYSQSAQMLLRRALHEDIDLSTIHKELIDSEYLRSGTLPNQTDIFNGMNNAWRDLVQYYINTNQVPELMSVLNAKLINNKFFPIENTRAYDSLIDLIIFNPTIYLSQNILQNTEYVNLFIAMFNKMPKLMTEHIVSRNFDKGKEFGEFFCGYLFNILHHLICDPNPSLQEIALRIYHNLFVSIQALDIILAALTPPNTCFNALDFLCKSLSLNMSDEEKNFSYGAIRLFLCFNIFERLDEPHNVIMQLGAQIRQLTRNHPDIIIRIFNDEEFKEAAAQLIPAQRAKLRSMFLDENSSLELKQAFGESYTHTPRQRMSTAKKHCRPGDR